MYRLYKILRETARSLFLCFCFLAENLRSSEIALCLSHVEEVTGLYQQGLRREKSKKNSSVFKSIYILFQRFRFNLLKPTGHVMHQQFNIQQLYVLSTLYLCVLYLSENKQRLVPLTA